MSKSLHVPFMECHLFQVCTKKKQLPAPETRTAASFLRCLAVQMTLYVQQLTLSSMADFDKFVLSLDDSSISQQPAGAFISFTYFVD